MPKKTGGKKVDSAKQHKRAAAKKALAERKKLRAEQRKEFRKLANSAYERWNGGHLRAIVDKCTTMQESMIASSDKNQLVEVPDAAVNEIASRIDTFMQESVAKLAHHKGVAIHQIVIAPFAVKLPSERSIPLKHLIHWFGVAKKNALLLEQFNSHANRKNPDPTKPTKTGLVDSRPVRSPQEQEWLALQDKATKGIHLRKKGRKSTTAKVEEAKEVVAAVRHDEPVRRRPVDYIPPVYDRQFTRPPGSLSSRRTQYPTFNLG